MGTGRGNSRLRLVDRYLGIPVVFAAGMLRRKRQLPHNPRQIGLLNTAAIGDTVLMSAVVADIRHHFGDSIITLLVGPSNYQAARMIDGVNDVVRLDVFNPYASLRKLRQHRVDVLIDFGPWSRLNSLYTIFSGAAFSVGFRTAREYRHYGYDASVDHGSEVHELENHRRLVRAIGVEAAHLPSLRTIADGEHLTPHAERLIVLHMWPGGSGAELKEWPTERWLAVANALISEGYHVGLTGSPEQQSLNEAFISLLDHCVRHLVTNMAGGSLADTALVLSRASLVISVNTGVMHMAAAAGVPLVALHGPTNAARWGPISDRAISIESPLSGCGYLNLGFEYPREPPACMTAISTEMVLAASRLAIERCPSTAVRVPSEELPLPSRWKTRCGAPDPKTAIQVSSLSTEPVPKP